VQPVALFALEVTEVHAVIALQVPDDRLDRLAPFEQCFKVAAMPTFTPNS
jgi:hypothetical protein